MSDREPPDYTWYIYPFGHFKGQPLHRIPENVIRESEVWCREHGKIEVANACAAYLEMDKPDFMNPDDSPYF